MTWNLDPGIFWFLAYVGLLAVMGLWTLVVERDGATDDPPQNASQCVSIDYSGGGNR